MPLAAHDNAQKYQSQWQAYRARRLRLWVVVFVEFFAFIPFMGFTEKAFKHFLPAGNSSFLTAFFLFAVVYLFPITRFRSFPCPRCRKNFFGGFFATPSTMLGRNCANCGLRKYDGE